LGVKGIGIELEIYGDKGVNDEKGYLQEREGYYFPRERRETSCLLLREELKLKDMFENGVLRGIFGSKGEEITGG
jgi:hypothetical protein